MAAASTCVKLLCVSVSAVKLGRSLRESKSKLEPVGPLNVQSVRIQQQWALPYGECPLPLKVTKLDASGIQAAQTWSMFLQDL